MKNSYNAYKELVNEFLMDYIPPIDEKSRVLHDAMEYSLKAGGKRLRPVLLLAACDFAGGDIKDAIPYACAIEYIHTYSLIHDDLPAMDDDDYRRGQLTNHKVFGEAIAILAGDGLLNTAFEVMTKEMYLHFDDLKKLRCRINAMNIIGKNSGVGGMIAGQVSDIEAEDKDSSLEMLEYIHLNKTASLIVAAIRAGLYLGGADNVMMSKMTIYAEYLGLVFQISDDILDVEGCQEELGKCTGSDAEKHKLTYVSNQGMAASKEKLRKYTNCAVEAIEDYYDNAEFFRDLVLELEGRKI